MAENIEAGATVGVDELDVSSIVPEVNRLPIPDLSAKKLSEQITRMQQPLDLASLERTPMVKILRQFGSDTEYSN